MTTTAAFYRPDTTELELDESPVPLPVAPNTKISNPSSASSSIIHPNRTNPPPSNPLESMNRAGQTRRYRKVFRQMSSEMAQLQQHIERLETQNKLLQQEESSQHELDVATAVTPIRDATELFRGLSKEELLYRYAELREKDAAMTDQLALYKDRVHLLQNELIKKNEAEFQFIKVTDAHASQNSLIQKLQVKLQKEQKIRSTLEQQRLIIAKLEAHLAALQGGQHNVENKSRASNSSATTAAILEENQKLRLEVEQLKARDGKNDGHVAMPSQSKKIDEISESNENQLYKLVEDAELQYGELQRQFASSTKQWRKEKEAMQSLLSST